MAPGITSTTALSTISITVIERVSDAKARLSALRNGTAPASSGCKVNA